MKKCNKCHLKKEIGEFYKNEQSKDGHRNNCKTCEKSRKKKYFSSSNVKAKEKIRKKEYRSIEANRVKAMKKTRDWYRSNKDRVREYQIKNANRLNANNAKRRAKKLNATLPGFDEELKEIYKNCPKGFHVDHIIPLQGKTVSGLHVPWNLQYLTAEENLKKSNKLIEGTND